jgi:NAD dependent epimerase/dehydratase family enzyme
MSQKILVAGATGFVGRNLIPALLNNQYEVSALGRDRNKLEKALPHLKSYLLWQDLDKVSPEEFDIIINLAGENIAEGRWNEKNKAKIINSRVETTSKLVNW